MRYLLHFIIVTIVALAALAGCRGRDHDPRLAAAADSIAADPKGAAAFLKDIDPASLSADDRHYRDLLTIKALDKAYAIHTSDSLILSVLTWARDYGDDDILTEALYYGGRVYTDLGDYPTAVRYYQDALDRLPPDNCDINLRANILSQTAYVFTYLKLFDQAICHLTEGIALDKQLCDTFAIVHDNEFLARVYIDKGEYEEAIKHYMTAFQLSLMLDATDVADIQLELANAYYLSGNNEPALALLNGVLETIKNDTKIDDTMVDESINFYNAVASKIYYQAGVYDSAFKYSRLLIETNDPNRQISGYRTLLKPELESRMQTDSVRKFITCYIAAISADYDKRTTEASVFQNSYFNYSRYERENENLSRSKDIMQRWIYGLVAGIIILSCLVITFRTREAKKRLRLQRVLFEIRELNPSLNVHSLPQPLPQSIASLEDEIGAEISQLLQKAAENPDGKKHLWIHTEAYEMISTRIKEGKPIAERDDRWDVITDCINEVNPEFFPALKRLSAGSLTIPEYHVASLIHMGFSSSEIAIVIGRVKGAITYQRKALANKLLGDSNLFRNIDSVLRSI